MSARINQRDRLGRRLPQDGNKFVQVFGLAVQRCERDLAGKQARQGAVVAVEIESLPSDAALIKPARAGGGFGSRKSKERILVNSH